MSTHIINFPGADIHTTTITSVSNVSVGENLDVASNLTVSGNTTVSQELSVSGNVEVGTANLFVDTTTGNVGVGVAHPTSAKLQVAGSLGMAKGSEFFAGDDVVMELPKHDRPLVKYPEVAMTAASTGGYTVDASTYNAQYYPFKALNGLKGASSGDVGWYTGSSDYTGTSNVYVGTERLSSETDLGEWITIELPNPIKLVETHLWTQFNYFHVPKGGVFYGKRNASDTWTQLYSYTENPIKDQYSPQIHIINETRYFKYFAYVATEKYSSDAGIAVGEWELYGHEEGDTSVDVVHRSIPNKPGQQHLEVYWDANDSNSYSFADSSNVYDLSGSGVTGTITGTNSFDAEYNAWVFDGSGDYISGTLSNPAGDWVHSVSCWVSATELSSTKARFITHYGVEALRQQVILSLTPGRVRVDFNSDSIYKDVSPFVLNTWYHIAFTYSGGGTSNVKIYINGVDVGVSGGGTTALNIASGRTLYVGKELNLAYNDPWKGSIANFRLFGGKVLNADQVRELYEYDAPRFGHRQNLVSLHKGNLGVGVTHPTSRFEVAGDETLQEYPPKAMTGYETYIEGHGVFRASASSERNNGGNATWHAFDSEAINTYWINIFDDDDYKYAGTSNTYSGISQLSSETPLGEYITLECPYKIIPQMVGFKPYSNMNHQPLNAVVYGSNDGYTWTFISSLQNMSGYSTNYIKTFSLNNTSKEGYRYVSFITTQVTGTSPYLRFFTYRIYGTPTPSGLEDGHLTLGKALTLPRVSGHPAGAETPRAESLVVHYDTTVDSVVSGSTAVDISGEGNNGTFVGDAAYSSTDRAFVFDGSGDRITTTAPFSVGDNTFSVSLWVKRNANGGTYCPIYIGDPASGQGIGMDIYTDGTVYWFIYGGKNFRWGGVSSTWFPVGSWTHVVASHTDGIDFANLNKVWINGVEMSGSATFSGTSDLYLDTNDGVTLGARVNNNYLNGQISNFKLYDVALTAEEVSMEYALGRTGKSLNLTDTSLCLGGTVPRAQLDVRGTGMFDGGLVIKYKNSLEYARDGGIMMSRAGLGNVTNKYSSQPIILDGGDSGAIDGNLRGGAIWSQWGGSQYGIAMRGASLGDTYPYLQDPALFVTKDNVGIGTANPAAKLDVNGYILNNNPAFHAYKTGGASTTNTGAFNAFTDVFLNRGGHYYTSGGNVGKFIAPVAGVYYFSANMLHRQAGANGSGEITFYKNGTNISSRAFGYTYVSAGSDHDNLHIETMIELAVNDYVQVAIHSLGSSTNFYYGEGLANFRGFLIG